MPLQPMASANNPPITGSVTGVKPLIAPIIANVRASSCPE